MRASVSDILLFRKCPRAWWYARQWVGTPGPAQALGTDIHARFADFWVKRIYNVLPLQGVALEDWKKVSEPYQILAVEAPFEVDFRGHTVLFRPDAILKHRNTENLYTWQLKTVSRNLPAHIDFVRVSPHEVTYCALAERLIGKRVHGTILTRYVKVNNPYTSSEFISRVKLQIEDQILDSIYHTLNQMEAYAGEELPTNIPMYTNSCVDWITGTKCAYFNTCYSNADPSTYLSPAPNRYADLQTKKFTKDMIEILETNDEVKP